MSLVGFKAKNHPQQRTDDSTDDRATAAEVFDPLNARYGFTSRFLAGRLRFLKPGQTTIAPDERPPFGCVLLTWEGHTPGSRSDQGVLL